MLSDDGKKSEINSPENLKALEFMVNGIKEGAAPKAVTTYMEEPARRAFEAGRAPSSATGRTPTRWATRRRRSRTSSRSPRTRPSRAAARPRILGGHNMVISRLSKNPGGTLKFIDYMTSADVMKSNAVKYSKSPVMKATYDDADVQKALPFSEELKEAVEQAQSRPVTPVYSLVSEAIYKNVNAALSGGTSPQDALKNADAQINKALATF